MLSEEKVVKEFPKVGKYRVRVLEKGKKRVLDIREYVQSDMFEGFTRRGIRLTPEEAAELKAVLTFFLDDLAEKQHEEEAPRWTYNPAN